MSKHNSIPKKRQKKGVKKRQKKREKKREKYSLCIALQPQNYELILSQTDNDSALGLDDTWWVVQTPERR